MATGEYVCGMCGSLVAGPHKCNPHYSYASDYNACSEALKEQLAHQHNRDELFGDMVELLIPIAELKPEEYYHCDLSITAPKARAILAKRKAAGEVGE